MIPVASGLSVNEMVELTKAVGDFSCLYAISYKFTQITIYQAETNWNNGWLWCDFVDYVAGEIVPYRLKP